MPHQAYVRVIGTQLGRYIEFEFTLDDADLTVELVMPPAAFEEFCAAQGAEILPPADPVAGALAGLYRPPAHQSQSDSRS